MSILKWSNVKRLCKVEKERGKKCINCKSKKIEYRQFSPDLGGMYFCSCKCHNLFMKERFIRAMPMKKIGEKNKKLEIK